MIGGNFSNSVLQELLALKIFSISSSKGLSFLYVFFNLLGLDGFSIDDSVRFGLIELAFISLSGKGVEILEEPMYI